MPSCNTYRLTWVFLTLEEGYLLMAAPPDLECGVAPLCPPAPMQLQLLRWGSSSQPPPLNSDVGLLLSASPVLSQSGASVAAPDLGRGVAPLGHASVQSVAAAMLLRSLCAHRVERNIHRFRILPY